jgi:RNA polymerase sigma factor (sigma-70 family)
VTADVGGSATDAEFAAGFQRDPELFTAVYDKYFRDVYRYVAGRLDNEAADDIAARRKEARHYAALARRAPEPVGYSEENRIVDAVAAVYMRPLLAKALATLPQGERDVVLLLALGQLSHEEISQALGIPSGTVGSRLSRARKKLHHVIDQEAVNGR